MVGCGLLGARLQCTVLRRPAQHYLKNLLATALQKKRLFCAAGTSSRFHEHSNFGRWKHSSAQVAEFFKEKYVLGNTNHVSVRFGPVSLAYAKPRQKEARKTHRVYDTGIKMKRQIAFGYAVTTVLLSDQFLVLTIHIKCATIHTTPRTVTSIS